MNYNKKPLTHSQQIDLWEKRGLIIPDRNKAEFYFRNISYYRLSAYALAFQKSKDRFNRGTTFDDVLHLYIFDRELRLVVMDAIERIEIAIRTQIIYNLAHKYGSHWQDNPSLFKVSRYREKSGAMVTKDVYTDFLNIISKHCRSKYPEIFIQHYLKKYNSPSNPPSWMVVELLTIGELSRLYSGLKNNDDKRKVADYFSLHHTIFESWLHTLTYARNLCAHHCRFWNRDFVIQPEIPKKSLKLAWLSHPNIINRRSFYFLCLIKYFLQTVNPGSHFKQRLFGVMDKYPNTPIQFMGIPTDNFGKLIDWQQEPLWVQ